MLTRYLEEKDHNVENITFWLDLEDKFRKLYQTKSDSEFIKMSHELILEIDPKLEFQLNFNLFTEHLFTYLDWNHLVVVGGSVLASYRYENNKCVEKPNKDQNSASELRKYFRTEWKEFPIVICLWGMHNNEIVNKIREIIASIQMFSPYEVKLFLKQPYLILVTDPRYPEILIELTKYKDKTEILINQSVDPLAIGYDGSKILMNIRADYAINYEKIHDHPQADTYLVHKLCKLGYEVVNLEPTLDLYKKDYSKLNMKDRRWVNIHFGSERKYDQLIRKNQLRTETFVDEVLEKNTLITVNLEDIQSLIQEPIQWNHTWILTECEDTKINQHEEKNLDPIEETIFNQNLSQFDLLIKEVDQQKLQTYFNLVIALRRDNFLASFQHHGSLQIPIFITEDPIFLKKLVQMGFSSDELISWLLQSQQKDPQNHTYLSLIKLLLERQLIKQFSVTDINYPLIRLILTTDSRFINRYLTDQNLSYTPLSKIVAIISKKINRYYRMKFLSELVKNPKSLEEDECRYLLDYHFNIQLEEKIFQDCKRILYLLDQHKFYSYLKEKNPKVIPDLQLFQLENNAEITDQKILSEVQRIWKGELINSNLLPATLTVMIGISKRTILEIVFSKDRVDLFEKILNYLSDHQLSIIMNHRSRNGKLIEQIIKKEATDFLKILIYNPRTTKYFNDDYYLIALLTSNLEIISDLEQFRKNKNFLLKIASKATPRIIYYLLKYHSDPEDINQIDNNGNTILHLLVRECCTSFDELATCIRLIYHLDPNIIHKTNKIGQSALFNTVNNPEKLLLPLLLQLGSDISLLDIEGQTVLHKAIYAERVDLIELILFHEPTMIDIVDLLGRTPLMLAISKNLKNISELLIKSGAQTNILDYYNNTLSHYLARYATFELSVNTEQKENVFGMTPKLYLKRRIEQKIKNKDFIGIADLDMRLSKMNNNDKIV